MEKHRLFITGAAGYVGEMLCAAAALREDVEQVIALDKSPQTDFLRDLPKLTYIEHNLADDGWQERVAALLPTAVVHTAWQIRMLYGNEAEQWRGNIVGSEKLFAFTFSTPGIKSLVHFSTAALYSARPLNRLDQRFTEDAPLVTDDYPYAYEKRISEERLEAAYKNAVSLKPAIVIVRPAAITGPRGRYIKTRFGLQSALEGNLRGGFLAKVVTLLTFFMPGTRGFVRQFVHEDDVVRAVLQFALSPQASPFETYNLAPLGPALNASEMALVVGKRVLWLPACMVRVAFWLVWHVTKGRIPTAPGSWRFFSYPLLLDGQKLAKVYRCEFDTKTAFATTKGHYEHLLPTTSKRG